MKLSTFTMDGLQDLDPDTKEYWVQRCKFAENRAQLLEIKLHQLQLYESWRTNPDGMGR